MVKRIAYVKPSAAASLVVCCQRFHVPILNSLTSKEPFDRPLVVIEAGGLHINRDDILSSLFGRGWRGTVQLLSESVAEALEFKEACHQVFVVLLLRALLGETGLFRLRAVLGRAEGQILILHEGIVLIWGQAE